MSDYISEDTIALILKYLPVKSLFRFRSVCKRWKELIDSPTFLNDHLAVQNPSMIFEYGQSEEFLLVDPCTLSIDTLICPIGFRRGYRRMMSIFGTLHGVVCLCDWERDLLIWNPSIRKSFTLTVPLPHDFQSDIVEYSRDCYGFWIDPSTKEFKIIIMLFWIHLEDRYVRQVHLYSSMRHGWSVIPQEKLGKWVSSRESSAVMIGDLGHWVGDYPYSPNENVIMSFDFKQESFEFIEVTDLKYFGESVPCRWQGKLSLLYLDCYNFPHRCDLYSRQEGNSWVNIFGFVISAPIVNVFCPLEDMEEMGRDLVEALQEKGRVVATVRDESRMIVEDELVLCDAKTGCIPLKRGPINLAFANMAYDFVESLLFPE